MKIRRITFLGLRGLPNASFDLADASGIPRDLVLVTGSPASGKTRLLEAIVAAKEGLAPYGPAIEGRAWLSGDSERAKVTMTVFLDEEEQAYANLMQSEMDAEVQLQRDRAAWDADDGVIAVLGRYEHTRVGGVSTGKLEYLPATRALTLSGPAANLDATEQRRHRASSDARKYSFVSRYISELVAGASEANAFAERLAALSPTCRFIGSEAHERAPRSFTSRGRATSLAELSSGEADAVLIAATARVVGLDRSLVLIDRPDLHVGADDAASLLAGLRALGKHNQLFLATSSAELIAATDGAAAVIDLDAQVQASPVLRKDA